MGKTLIPSITAKIPHIRAADRIVLCGVVAGAAGREKSGVHIASGISLATGFRTWGSGSLGCLDFYLFTLISTFVEAQTL